MILIIFIIPITNILNPKLDRWIQTTYNSYWKTIESNRSLLGCQVLLTSLKNGGGIK